MEHHESNLRETELTLILTANDLDDRTKGRLDALQQGKKVLGGEDETKRVLMDAIPASIAKRLTMITPPDFSISEVAIKFKLGGKIFGIGVEGEVMVKLKPHD